MSKFYARFKESKEEIIVFQTQEQRDEWVNFKDEFSRSIKSTPETATFQRIPLTEEQANYIIKTLGLTEEIEKDITGKFVTKYVPKTTEGEKNTMKKKNKKINLQPTMGVTERKMIASATEKNAKSSKFKNNFEKPIDKPLRM